MVEELERCGVTLVPPPIQDQLGPGSLDLRVGRICTFIKSKEHNKIYTLDSPPPLKEENLDHGFVIEPDTAVLITTMESVHLPLPPRVVGWITNKSSLARKGLSVATQFVDPGHSGPLTVLLENLSRFPITVCRGDRIVQMILIPAEHNPHAWYKAEQTPPRNKPGPNFLTSLTLGDTFGIFKGSGAVKNITMPEGKSFTLNPGEFVLGITREEISLESEGVVGMLVYTDAYFYQDVWVSEGLLNPGFKGKIVLEIKNRSNLPVKLVPGVEIYRVYYCSAFTFGSYVQTPGSKYVGEEKTNRPQL